MANKAQPKLIFHKGYGNNLKQLRKKHNLTLKEMGEKLNFSDKTINLIETETRYPTIEQINAYCSKFNVSLDYLTGRTNISEPTIEMISEYIGLSEEAIMELIYLKGTQTLIAGTGKRIKTTDILNKLFLNQYFKKIIECLASYSISTKLAVSKIIGDDSDNFNLEGIVQDISYAKLDFFEANQFFSKIAEIFKNPAFDLAVDIFNKYNKPRFICNKLKMPLSPPIDTTDSEAMEAYNQICKQYIDDINKLREEFKKEDTDNAQHNPTQE